MGTTQLTEEEVINRDLSAHTDSLREKRDIVAAELNEVTELKKTAQKEHDDLRNKISLAIDALDGIISRTAEAQVSQRETLRIHEKKLAGVLALITEAEGRLKVLLDNEAVSGEEIVERQNRIRDLKTEEDSIKNSITGLAVKFLDFKQTTSLEKSKVRSSLQDGESILGERLDIVSELDYEIESKRGELKSVLSLIEEERAKIELPLQSLAQREAELEQRIATYQIYRRRLIKYYGNVFPGLNIDI